MARTTPSSQPYHRSASSSSRHSRQPSSSGSIPQYQSGASGADAQTRSGSGSSSGSSGSGSQSKHAGSRTNATTSSGNKNGNNNPAYSSGNKKLTSASTLPSLLSIPLMLIHTIYRLFKLLFGIKSLEDLDDTSQSAMSQSNNQSGNKNSKVDTNAESDFDEIIKAVLERSKDSTTDGTTLSTVTTLTTTNADGLEEYLTVPASPALTTLLDDALYRAYAAELVPTVAAASRLLTEFIEMKECAALVLKECRWMTGVPFGGGLALQKVDVGNDANNDKVREFALGEGVLKGQFLGEGAVVNEEGLPYKELDNTTLGSSGGNKSRRGSGGNDSSDTAEAMYAEEISRWNEFDTIQDFAHQCLLSAIEAITRLTTDRLAEGANITLHESIEAVENREGRAAAGGAGGMSDMSADGLGVGDVATGGLPQSQTGPSTSSSSGSASATNNPNSATPWSSFQAPADAGIGRCYHPLPRKDCWESPRLYCPDYYWADDAIGGCQRLIKTLGKHRFISMGDRFGSSGGAGSAVDAATRRGADSIKQTNTSNRRTLSPPTHATSTPHPFPSLEAAHALTYLTDLLYSTLPSRLNQFRAAAEANAVVSKRLYLVKCEYRAPMHALWESYANWNAAPNVELVERYLREFHGVKVGTTGIGGEKAAAGLESGTAGEIASGGTSSGSSKLRRKGSVETVKKSAIQQQREKLEKLITEKYWKHPAFVEALQLERCCERMEIEMSQMLLPLSNLAAEIMNEWKGRVRAVAVVNSNYLEDDDDGEVEAERGGEGGKSEEDLIMVSLGWEEVPFMRELLRRLKSILRRKPDVDESTGIRPLLLDLQGVPRHKADPIQSSIEMPFYPQPPRGKLSLLERLFGSSDKTVENTDDPWFHLEKFLAEVHKLLELLNIPNTPFLVEERTAGSKGNKNTLLDLIEQINDVWDEEMFRAQYQDWYDMVQRQQKLNVGSGSGSNDVGTLENTQQQSEDSQPMATLSELSETIREAEIELSIAMASKDQLERVHKRLQALRADKLARYKVLAQIVFDVGYRELNDGIVVHPPAEDATVEFPKLSIPGVFGEQLTMAGEVLPVG